LAQVGLEELAQEVQAAVVEGSEDAGGGEAALRGRAEQAAAEDVEDAGGEAVLTGQAEPEVDDDDDEDVASGHGSEVGSICDETEHERGRYEEDGDDMEHERARYEDTGDVDLFMCSADGQIYAASSSDACRSKIRLKWRDAWHKHKRLSGS